MGSIFWLASYPKSGNTWLRAFIANLIADPVEPLPLSELPKYCEDEARPERYSALAGRPSSELDIGELCALRDQVHAQIAAEAAGTVFVKTHNFAGDYDGHPLHNAAVTAGAAYVVRNPLDVVVSMSHHFGTGIDEAIERLNSDGVGTLNDELFVGQVLGSWAGHVESWAALEGPRFPVLRYEDLLEKPGKAFGKLARLLGVADRARVERAVRHASFRNLAGMERRDGFVEASDKAGRFFRAGRANQWREALSREQVTRVVEANRDTMKRFKYLPPGF